MDTPDSRSSRPSTPAERAELLRKVEALIAVLEIAHGKVKTDAMRPGADRYRLSRVRRKVSNTLAVCRQARMALRGGRPITAEDVRNVDLDELCRRLAALDLDELGA